MTKRVKRRRGTTAQHAAFTGAMAEVTVDTDTGVMRVHNGATPGGAPVGPYLTSEWFGGYEGIDETTAINAALDHAYTERIGAVRLLPRRHIVLGQIEVPPGVTLFGDTLTGEYENNIPANIPYAAWLEKPSAGSSNGPVVELGYASALHHVTLKHLKSGGANTGVLRIGPTALDTDIVNASASHFSLIGLRTTEVATANTCYGIYFPESESGNARFFNQFTHFRVSECDVALRLSGNSNGNLFSTFTLRENHIGIELFGDTTSCIENSFGTFGIFTMASLTPAAICFRLRGTCQRNAFLGYVTEAQGTEFSIDAASADGYNIFLGSSNESGGYSHARGNWNMLYGRPTNLNEFGEQYYISQAASVADRYVNGRGSSVVLTKVISGTLPQIANAAGTLVASDADNKKIITFPVQKASLVSFSAKLQVKAYSPSNRGMHLIEVDFMYRNTNQSTEAGQLCVTRVVNKGNGSPEVTGLYFIKGTTGTPRTFAIALVGGNNSTTPFDAIAVRLEFDAIAYASSLIQMDALRTGFSFATADVTADDVTDGVSLLAVADTAV